MMETSERTPGAVGAAGRAILAACVMGLALAVATWAGALLGLAASPDHPLLARLAVAAAVTVVVVALIVLLCRRGDRAPLSSIGLTGTVADVRGFLLGAGIVLATGLVAIGALTVFGAARWSDFDPLTLLVFLTTNAIVALLFEALPEEISIRGYALTVLRRYFSQSIATVLNIATFLLVPLIALSAHALLERTRGETESVFALAPGGQDALMYYLMLTVFGLLLIRARDSTASATIWTCVGAHLAWLTVNRVVLDQAPGVQVDLGEIATLLFFAIYVSAAIYAFSTLNARVEKVAAEAR